MNPADQTRRRVQNMAIYFVANTSMVNQLKLEKLFFFADLAFCRDIGLSISEQNYLARDLGPVPVSPDKKESLFQAYQLGEVLSSDAQGFYSPVAGAVFNGDLFSPRELSCIEKTAREFSDSSGEDMSALTHTKGEVWENGSGLDQE